VICVQSFEYSWYYYVVHKRYYVVTIVCLLLLSVCLVQVKVGKVKCTLVQALRLCTGRTAHRGSTGIALPFHDHSTRRGWGVSVTPRPLFTPGKDPVPILLEAGWAPGPVWIGAENFAPHPRNVQPVTGRYSDWAIPAHCLVQSVRKIDKYAELNGCIS
jgi:hypothetical protein